MFNDALVKELIEYVEQHLYTPKLYQCSDLIFHESKQHELEDYIKEKRQPTFIEVLFRFIDKKGKTDTEIYKKAGIDRRHFSKIRSNTSYRIGKPTAIALAFALELNKKETEKLLSSAGFALTDNDTFDLVIQFCLEKKIYDLMSVNQALHHFDLKTLV